MSKFSGVVFLSFSQTCSQRLSSLKEREGTRLEPDHTNENTEETVLLTKVYSSYVYRKKIFKPITFYN